MISASIAGCQDGSGASDVKVVNGIEVENYVAVVRVDVDTFGRSCTGTFLDETTVATAAHCVAGTGGTFADLSIAGVKPLAIHYDHAVIAELAAEAQTGQVDAWANSRDMALLKMPAGAAETALALAQFRHDYSGIYVGQPVKLIGYGAGALTSGARPDGRKHVGYNVVSGWAGHMIIVAGLCDRSPAVSLGHQASLSFGDSGGPLLDEDFHVIGIASAAACIDGVGYSYFASLTSPTFTALAAEANYR